MDTSTLIYEQLSDIDYGLNPSNLATNVDRIRSNGIITYNTISDLSSEVNNNTQVFKEGMKDLQIIAVLLIILVTIGIVDFIRRIFTPFKR